MRVFSLAKRLSLVRQWNEEEGGEKGRKSREKKKDVEEKTRQKLYMPPVTAALNETTRDKKNDHPVNIFAAEVGRGVGNRLTLRNEDDDQPRRSRCARLRP